MKKQKPRHISGAQMHFSHPLPSGLYRRLRNRTGSTALAARGLRLSPSPPVGNFTPPLRLLYILSHFESVLSIAMRHLVSPRQKFTLDSNIKAQLNGLQSAVCGPWVKSRTDERFIPLYFAPPYVILNPDKQTEATA